MIPLDPIAQGRLEAAALLALVRGATSPSIASPGSGPGVEGIGVTSLHPGVIQPWTESTAGGQA